MNIIKKITTAIFLSLMMVNPANAQILSVEAISVSSDEVLGDGLSFSVSISTDGRYVAFLSESTNIVAGDTNGASDVFLRDRTLGTTEIISVSSGDVLGDDSSSLASTSDDGRYVAFASDATNLVAGDTNAVADIFLRDRTLGTTERISLSTADGETDGVSYNPIITPDGRYVIFSSEATNLVAGDTNGAVDLFLIDLQEDETEIISVSSGEVIGNGNSGSVGLNSISEDGRYIVFESAATNLVAGDTNGATDVFLRDRTLGTTEIISVSSDEDLANGDASSSRVTDDGVYVVFASDATNMVAGDTNSSTDIFLRNRTLGTTTLISSSSSAVIGNSDSILPFVSSDGRFITFGSTATNLVSGDTNGDPDAFLKDTLTGTTERISLTEDIEEANGNTFNLAVGLLSSNAQYVVLTSGHSDIVSGDENDNFDVFLYELDDNDGIAASVEKSAPNNGDVDENGFIDSAEQNVSSFVNSVTSNYSTIVTTGDCSRNDSPSTAAESSLATQDSSYDYPLGIISFNIDCKDTGETATISVYCFCENTPVSGTIARKYSESTGEYTTIDSAVIEEVTIDGQRALKMTYDVTDGGPLDEDGLENGTIIDPVGFARAIPTSSSSSSSSGSRPRKDVVAQNTTNTESLNTPINDDSCEKYSFVTPMKKGSKFGEVSKLQELLNKKGINVGTVDGLFGPLTDSAVKQFQSQNTLDSDGIVGPMTRSVLNQVCK